jgi:hypothetical protein
MQVRQSSQIQPIRRSQSSCKSLPKQASISSQGQTVEGWMDYKWISVDVT